MGTFDIFQKLEILEFINFRMRWVVADSPSYGARELRWR